jgi:Utp11 protein
MLKLLKSQDRKYIQLKKTSEDQKIAKLQGSLHLTSQEIQNKHLIFTNDEDVNEGSEVPLVKDSKKRTKSTTKLIDNMPIIDDEDSEVEEKREKLLSGTGTLESVDKKTRKKIARKQSSSYRELEERKKRSDELGKLLSTIDLHQHLMGKGKRRKIAPGVYKWKTERKK